MNIPDWLWQNTETNLLEEVAAFMPIVHYTIKAARWAVTKYGKSRAIQGKPVYVSATIQGKSTVEATSTVKKSLGTPSPARRLEELASWYLHVS